MALPSNSSDMRRRRRRLDLADPSGRGYLDHAGEEAEDPFPQFLGLLDIQALYALQYSTFKGVTGYLGRRPSLSHTLILGRGGSFIVRRILFNLPQHSVAAWSEPWEPSNSKFVVVKQPIIQRTTDEQDIRRLRAVLLELKILNHKSIRQHPNIVTLLQISWSFQDGPELVCPMLVMEYAELGPLSAFQDPQRIVLTGRTKILILKDIAIALDFLHRCGIVHGDVKSENVLIFLKHDKGYQAKISDFGSSLLEVFTAPGSKSRRLISHTLLWRAPEYNQLLTPQGLRRTDIYSYGLMVWRVLLDGMNPDRLLSTDVTSKELRTPGNVIENESDTSMEDSAIYFDECKSIGDNLHTWAMQSIRKVPFPITDDNLEKLGSLLFGLTIKRNPDSRAKGFDEILNVFKSYTTTGSEIDETPYPHAPETLVFGDFGIFSSSFPNQVYNLKSSPPTFRRLICEHLYSAFKFLPSTDNRKAQSAVALAICYIQGFSPDETLHDPLELLAQAVSFGHFGAERICHQLTKDIQPLISASNQSEIADKYHGDDEKSALISAMNATCLNNADGFPNNVVDTRVIEDQGLDPIPAALKTRSLSSLKLLLHDIKDRREGPPDFKYLLPFLTGQFVSPFSLLMQSKPVAEAFLFPTLDLLHEAGVEVDERGLLCQAIEDDNVSIADHYIIKLQLNTRRRWEPYHFTLLDSENTIDIDINLESFLETAIWSCKPAMVDMLLNHINALESSITPGGGTYLGNLSARMSLEDSELDHIASSLALHGADVTAVNSYGNGPLYEAVKTNRLGAVRAMLQLGASIEDSRRAFSICLHDTYSQVSPTIMNEIAAARPQVLLFPPDIRPSFLSPMMNFKTQDANYVRVLCRADETERDDVINILKLENILTTLKKQPQGEETIRALLYDQVDGADMSPLHAAAASGNIKAATILLAEGANVNQCASLSKPGWETDLDAELAAILASTSVELDEIQLLTQTPDLGLDKTANPIDLNGPTPLDLALGRSWTVQQQIFSNPHMHDLIREIEWAGGHQAVQKEFNQKTTAIVELLRRKGGKTAVELMVVD